MTTDRVTKALLLAAAVGLWANVAFYWMAGTTPVPPTPRTQVSDALPWSMGAKSMEQIDGGAHLDGGTTRAYAAYINFSGDVSSPTRAVLTADEVTVHRIPNTRNVDAELRGNVHLRYTILR